ncbi:MAG: hypothetical protein ACPGTR_02370 [Opitutales bacterium]|jgi:hypothetical protein
MDMETKAKNIQAMPRPHGDGHQVSYELGHSRKVHQFKLPASPTEAPPHGAGSYHDPVQHEKWMARIDAYLTAQRSDPS